jgi:DNA-binding NtrC family response regulator
LENLVERLMILVSDDVVQVSDLPEKFHEALPKKDDAHDRDRQPSGAIDIPEYGIDLNSVVGNMEKDLILRALEKTGGVRSKAATLLGLNRTTLIEKIKKMGIELRKS